MEMDVKYLRYLKYNYTERIERISGCIQKNGRFLAKIAEKYHAMLNLPTPEYSRLHERGQKSTEAGKEKMRLLLKAFTREWSTFGKLERDLCYKPIVDAVLGYYPECKNN